MSVYFAFKCNSCAPRVNRASFKGVTLTDKKLSHEEVTWEIAFWVKKQKMSEWVSGFPRDSLLEQAAVVLENNRGNAKLQELLSSLGGNSRACEAAMHRALVYVSRAFCKFSSVYPTAWLRKYQEYVEDEATEAAAKAAAESLDNELQLVLVGDKVDAA